MTKAKTIRKMSKRLKILAEVASAVWDLKLKKLEINEAMDDCYGRCWGERNVIEIRLMGLKDPEVMLSADSLRETLAHELAHLVFYDHDRSHRNFTYAISWWLKRNWDLKNFTKKKF